MIGRASRNRTVPKGVIFADSNLSKRDMIRILKDNDRGNYEEIGKLNFMLHKASLGIRLDHRFRKFDVILRLTKKKTLKTLFEIYKDILTGRVYNEVVLKALHEENYELIKLSIDLFDQVHDLRFEFSTRLIYTYKADFNPRKYPSTSPSS